MNKLYEQHDLTAEFEQLAAAINRELPRKFPWIGWERRFAEAVKRLVEDTAQ